MFTYNTMQTFIARARHGAAAHGGAAVRRPAPARGVPRRSSSTASSTMTRDGHPAARHRHARRRCATRSPSRSPWAARRTSRCTASRSRAPPASTSGSDVMSQAASSTRFAPRCRCSSTCARSAPTRWSTSTPRAALQVDRQASCSTPACSTAAALTCTGETLAEQVAAARSAGARRRRHPLRSRSRSRTTGGLRLLRGNLAPEGGAILKIAGVEGGIDGRRLHRPRARLQRRARRSSPRSRTTPDSFADRDMVVIRYEGPRGAPGMPELLDPDVADHGAVPPEEASRSRS